MNCLISPLALAYLPLQVYAVIRWPGVWRIAALVPILLMFLVFPFLAVSVKDSNNQLGPFTWIIFGYLGAAGGGCYLVILMGLRASVTLSGRLNDDAKPYQEKQVPRVIEEVQE